MSFTLLRAPLRKPFPLPFPRAQLKVTSRPSFRKFSTPPSPPPAPKKSNTGLYLGLGAAIAAGGFAYYYFEGSGKEAGSAIKAGVQVVKAKANFVPSQADYQKVGASDIDVLQCS